MSFIPPGVNPATIPPRFDSRTGLPINPGTLRTFSQSHPNQLREWRTLAGQTAAVGAERALAQYR